LRSLILEKDTFSRSLPVYTYDGASIVQAFCEAHGWPNVTHEGHVMYDNVYSASREVAVKRAKADVRSRVEFARGMVDGLAVQLAMAKKGTRSGFGRPRCAGGG
jgi:hypothetical protein